MSDDAGPSTPATPSLPPMPSLAFLDPTSRMVVGGAIVAVVAALLGAFINAWHSTDFLLVVLAGGIAAATAASYWASTSASPKPSPLPLDTIELAGGAVIAVLGGWRAIELVFDLDQIDDFGGILGVVLTVVLAGAGVATLVGALRRDRSIRQTAMRSDGTGIAVAGLAVLLLGWALNLSISYWTMAQGALTLSFATFAVVAIVSAPKWTKELPGIPIAWVGAAFGVLAAFLGLGQFGDLRRLGDRTELGLTDWGPFVLTVLGIVGIMVGGAMAGKAVWQTRPRTGAAAPDAEAEPAWPSAPPTASQAAEPVLPTEPPATSA